MHLKCEKSSSVVHSHNRLPHIYVRECPGVDRSQELKMLSEAKNSKKEKFQAI